jgi:hypothetical protein
VLSPSVASRCVEPPIQDVTRSCARGP